MIQLPEQNTIFQETETCFPTLYLSVRVVQEGTCPLPPLEVFKSASINFLDVPFLYFEKKITVQYFNKKNIIL